MSEIYIGIVEDRLTDPLMLGRCKVRVFGVHTPNKRELPTNDLPWAMVMTPVTSGSIDFIGQSPTGLIEGSTVVVFFADKDQQIPIIMGSLYSLPLDAANPLTVNSSNTSKWVPPKPVSDDKWKQGSTDVLVDSSNNPVKIESLNIDTMVCSEAGYNLIKNFEKLSSIVKGQNKWVDVAAAEKLSPTTPLYAYKDSVGKWTIGWGSTFLEGDIPVVESTVITKAQADALLVSKVTNGVARSIKRNLKVQVTQGMFDALCSLAYNMGNAGLYKTTIWTNLQAGSYESAATSITA